MRATKALLTLSVLLLSSATAHAQYNDVAATSAPVESVTVEVKGEGGKLERRTVMRAPTRDGFGNAAGSRFDLAVDGAFEGQTVAVLHFYTGEGFDFSLPKAALAEKGFSVYRWIGAPPSVEELRKGLEKSCQLWIISGMTRLLTDEHIAVIKEFFDSGKGVYIWGDNDPYYADANAVAEALLGAGMHGNLVGDQVVMLQKNGQGPGVVRDHLLTTGLEHLFEGITIATIDLGKDMHPLIYGSAGNLVAAYYDKHGKRAILDGGFTRLYLKWDTAGTSRYVKNAAAWLVNVERFGDAVVAAGVHKAKQPPEPSQPQFAQPPPPVPPAPPPTIAEPAAGAVVAETKADDLARWVLIGVGVAIAAVCVMVSRRSQARSSRGPSRS